MNENDKYIIKENYHGDIKLIKIDKPKVNLSKPTDILDHKSKAIEILNVAQSKKEVICLTKPQDLSQESVSSIQESTSQNNDKYSLKDLILMFLSFIIIVILVIIAILIMFIAIEDGLIVSALFMILIVGILGFSPIILILSALYTIISVIQYKKNRINRDIFQKRFKIFLPLDIISLGLTIILQFLF